MDTPTTPAPDTGHAPDTATAPRAAPALRAAPSTASGLLLVDKRGEWTSHDLVARTRRLAGTRKVGHAGTLDPMATGLMILGVNSSTRLLTYLVGLDKEYLATIRLGAATTTDDREGEVVSRAEAGRIRDLAAADVERAIADLRGVVSQVPSAVSAIKVDGKRAYARVRAGEEVELAAREVTISAFDVLRLEAVEPGVGADTGDAAPGDDGARLDLDVRITCSSGTYVRALARDLGRALGVGGHLTALRRTRVGPFHVDDAVPIDDLVVADRLIPPADAAARLFDVLHLTEQEAIDLGHGKKLTTPDEAPSGDPLAAVAPDGRLVGLVGFRGRTGTSLVNFPADERGAS